MTECCGVYRMVGMETEARLWEASASFHNEVTVLGLV